MNKAVSLFFALGTAFLAAVSVLTSVTEAAELGLEYNFSNVDFFALPQRLEIDKSGTLYGVLNYTSIIKLSPPPPGQTSWTRTIIYRSPVEINEGLLLGPDGVIYGTTSGADGNLGAVFALTPPTLGETSWSKTELYKFRGRGDGAYPLNRLLLRGTTLYGFTNYSGDASCVICQPGVVFSLRRNVAGAWKFSVVYRFRNFDEIPYSRDALAADRAGALYGSTRVGGTGCPSKYKGGCGTIFKLNPPSVNDGRLWTREMIHSFKGGLSGFNPQTGVIIDRDGIVYGTTTYEPSCQPYNSCGAIFRLTKPLPGQSVWSIRFLYRFKNAGEGGLYLESPLVLDGTGAIYGVAAPQNGWQRPCKAANFNACGAIFKLMPPTEPTSQWTKTELYSFEEPLSYPTQVVLGEKRTLFGIAKSGGRWGDGALFKLIQ